ANSCERPCCRSGLQFARIEELEKARYVRRLRRNDVNFAEMLAIHGEVMLVGLDGVFRDTFLDSNVLEKSLDPVLITHNCRGGLFLRLRAIALALRGPPFFLIAPLWAVIGAVN